MWVYVCGCALSVLCAHVSVFSVLTSGSCCGEVRMILWPTLPQPNPFLTVLVDPNGPTQTSWCRGDVLPWHRYWLYRQTVAREPGLLLLGAFRETPHNSEGKPIKKYQSMWLILLTERSCDLSIHKCVHLHMDLQFVWQAECTQTSFLPVYSVENIFLCTCKQEEDKKYFIFCSGLLNITFKVTNFLFSAFHRK